MLMQITVLVKILSRGQILADAYAQYHVHFRNCATSAMR